MTPSPTTYWNDVADKKVFTHPLQAGWLTDRLDNTASILDFGCGYGRTCATLRDCGFSNIVGADISGRMLERAKETLPDFQCVLLEGSTLPFPDDSFDCALMIAVLTCIPDPTRQQTLLREIRRIVKSDGLLFVSDYPLQEDERNRTRYTHFQPRYKTYGIFEIDSGMTMRHHDDNWFANSFDGFSLLEETSMQLKTMNGHSATIRHLLFEKRD